MSPRSWTVAILAAGAASIALVLATPATAAWAHAIPLSSSPTNGAVLAKPPARVSITFDQPVLPVASDIEVLDPAGKKVSGAVTPDGTIVKIALRPLTVEGTYTVGWRVISADSHPVSGVVTFSYGHPSRPVAPPAIRASPTVSALFALARFLAYAGFAVLVGAVAFCCYGYPGAAELPGMRRLIMAGWTVAIVGTVGEAVLQGPYAIGDGIGGIASPRLLTEALSSSYGTAIEIRVLVLAIVPSLVGFALARLPGASKAGQVSFGMAGGLIAVVLAATWAVAGHANTSSQRIGTLPADIAHLCAMAMWLGGLAAVALVVRARDAAATEGVARFSSVAAWSVTVLAGTGIYLAWLRVETLPALLTTHYGVTLLVKLTLVAAILGVACLSRRTLHRAIARAARAVRGVRREALPRLLGRLVAAEAAGALGVLLVTSVLVEEDPAVQAFATQPTTFAASYDTGGPSGTGRVQVRLPNQALGLTEATIVVLGRGGRPRSVPEVDVSWAYPARGLGPLATTVARAGTGRYQATSAPLTLSGQWDLDITVRTDAIDETTVRIPVTIW